MQDIDFAVLTRYAKQLANFTAAQESLLSAHGPEIRAHLRQITDLFYENLATVPEAAQFVGTHAEQLKNTHLTWLQTLFTGPYDEFYTAYMYRVGKILVQLNFPAEFMTGGMPLISEGLQRLLRSLYKDNEPLRSSLAIAVNGVLGYSSIIMQKSFQLSIEEQPEKFFRINDISRGLYSNIA